MLTLLGHLDATLCEKCPDHPALGHRLQHVPFREAARFPEFGEEADHGAR